MIAATPATSTAQPGFGQDQVRATEDRFLKLLVAQMKNQDPLNPLDNAQVTSQMAQLSTVTGINKLAELVQGLVASLAQSQTLAATGMIGRAVLSEGQQLRLDAGRATAGFALAGPADQVLVEIRDAAGRRVYSADVGPQPAGIGLFQWDGTRDDGNPAAPGVYAFEVHARAGGQPVAARPLTYGIVEAVSLRNDQVELTVPPLGTLALSQIVQVM